MLPRRWPSDTMTPSGRRTFYVAVLLLVLVVVTVAIVVISLAAATTTITTGRPSGLALMATDQHQIDTKTRKKAGLGSRRWWWWYSGSKRRELIGSVPPTCRYKCGRCSPCRAVHVPIQPGWSSPMEYYPEAWRCQCGNKLFMP